LSTGCCVFQILSSRKENRELQRFTGSLVMADMPGGASGLVIILFVLDIVVAIVVTRTIYRRGYTGLRKYLLLALAWLVPLIGGYCAAVAIWEHRRSASSATPVEDSFVGRSATESGVADDRRGPNSSE